MSFLFTILCVVILSNNHLIAQIDKDKKTPNDKSLPGVVKINDNLFCDRTEVYNVHWREYMYWTKKIYGESSKEFTATIPDTHVWSEVFKCLTILQDKYLTDPEYNYYPVIGITQEQAKSFSKWRSDRVFERILIEKGLIDEDTNQDSVTYFSIEKYFTGKYKNIVPNKSISYFPNYHLPTLTERMQVVNFSDSIDSLLSLQYKKKFLKLQSDINPCVNDTLKVMPTIYRQINSIKNERKLLSEIRGNVSEWASEIGITFGGSWRDKEDNILKEDTSRVEKQNCWTGFRNVCTWEKWDK